MGGRGSRTLEGHARVQAGPERDARRHARQRCAVGRLVPAATDCATREAVGPARSSERSSRASLRRRRRKVAEASRVSLGTGRPDSRLLTSRPMSQAPAALQPQGTESMRAP